jgi:hypothetical protein
MLSAVLALTISANAQSVPALGREDVAALDAVIAFQDDLGDSVWPGFGAFRTATSYFTEHGQYLLNAPAAPPAYFKPYRGPAPSWSARNWYAAERRKADGAVLGEQDDRETINSAYSSSQSDGHYAFSVFFQDSPSRFKAKGQKWSLEEWFSIYWHEVFHNFQDEFYRSREPIKGEQDYRILEPLLDDPANRKAVAAEQDLLVRALRERRPARKRKLACGFVEARLERRKRLSPEAVAAESYYESTEGTARYVEELLCVAGGRLPEKKRRGLDAGIAGHPDYSRFSKFKERSVEFYYALVAGDALGRSYHYQTGFGLALLLDQLVPDWKRGAFASRDLLFGRLAESCPSR